MNTTSTPVRVRLGDARRVVTAAATMCTYASPSGPASATIAIWRTEMGPEGAGPVHTVSEDQVIVLTEGSLSVTIGEQQHQLGPTDAIVLPAGVARQVTAGPQGAIGIVASLPGATARVGEADPVPVPWGR